MRIGGMGGGTSADEDMSCRVLCPRLHQVGFVSGLCFLYTVPISGWGCCTCNAQVSTVVCLLRRHWDRLV